jgi:uncharacterized protein
VPGRSVGCLGLRRRLWRSVGWLGLRQRLRLDDNGCCNHGVGGLLARTFSFPQVSAGRPWLIRRNSYGEYAVLSTLGQTATLLWTQGCGSVKFVAGVGDGLRQSLRIPSLLLIALIRVYQRTISRMLGDVCRYYPSCSKYAVGALSTHGAIKGTVLTARRLLRCTPFHAGGLDPVPPRGSWQPRIEPDGRIRPSHR